MGSGYSESHPSLSVLYFPFRQTTPSSGLLSRANAIVGQTSVNLRDRRRVVLLERVTAAAEERHLSQNTLTAYRRTWIKAIAWAAAEGLALETLPPERAGEYYEEATRGRSASHHLQVKAALALLYDVLGSTNPFAECPAPKFAPEKTELRYHTSSQLESSCANCARTVAATLDT